jgi:hypothetical protein
MGCFVVANYSGRKRRDFGGPLSHPVTGAGDRIAARVRRLSACPLECDCLSKG